MNAKKILGYALGPIGSAAFGLLSLPLISWYFPAEDIGRIVLLQTIAGLSILLLGLGLDQSYIRDYYAVKDKAALFKSVFLSPLILTVAVVVLVLLINASWPSEIIFDIPSANLGILFLIFLATTLIIRFLALILRMKEQALAFSVSQLAPKFFDFGVGFCRDCFRPARQYHFAGFCLHRRPSADRCAVDLSTAPRPASRFPCEMVA